jgi:hypothetical protein
MAITKTILKLTHIDAVVKIVNDSSTPASVTIAVATDLKRADETQTGTIDVRLSTVEYGLGTGGGKIMRSTADVLEMPASNHGMFTYELGNDPTQSNQDLVVTIGQGTVFIRLLKVAGYVPTFKPEQNGGY